MPSGERVVRFDVAPEVAFDYLVDPAHRPEWQSSLRAVEPLTDGPPRVGSRWIDKTWPGLQPRMETTVQDRPTRWAEVGHWHGLEAELTLTFTPRADGGTDVVAAMDFRGPAPWRPLALVLRRVSPAPVAADLRRAARLLAERGAERGTA
jgi:uncharacterized protein YndB with AHSA1/START domain